MKRLLAAAMMVFLLAGGALAANTTERTENIIHITFDGSTAWDGATELKAQIPNGCLIYGIGVFPAAANDTVTIRNGASGSAAIFKYKGVSGDSFYFKPPFPIECKPYIVGNQATASLELFLYVVNK